MQREAFTYYPPEEIPRERARYMQGISQVTGYYQGRTVFGHGGGTLGFTASMYWFENTDIIAVMLINIGRMHSGLQQSPPSIFYHEILLPAVMQYLDR